VIPRSNALAYPYWEEIVPVSAEPKSGGTYKDNGGQILIHTIYDFGHSESCLP